MGDLWKHPPDFSNQLLVDGIGKFTFGDIHISLNP